MDTVWRWLATRRSGRLASSLRYIVAAPRRGGAPDLRARRERGQSTVEFAVLLPVLILMTLGAADLGRLFVAEVRVANAAREGARQGARHPYDAAGMRQRVLDELGQASIGAGPDAVTAITVSQAATPSPPGGTEVQVTVTYQFALVTPVPLGTRTFTFSTTSAMLVI